MVGQVRQDQGIVFEGGRHTVVKQIGKAGDMIEKHNHPEATVLLTPVKGSIRVFLNEDEQHELTPGAMLTFDGINYIAAEFIEDGEFFVVLVKEKE